ncbi:MAG: hypothetical protein K2O56_00350 [Muribaculaceae bacterium]|nr:hypothetical protein [Muribaculaceae bacterium]
MQKNRTAPTWCGSSLFIAPSERTADGDREKNHRDESLDLIRLPTVNDHLAYVVSL